MKWLNAVLPAIVLMAGVLTTGCSTIENMDDASLIAQDVFEAIKAKDYDKTVDYYGIAFFAVTSEEEWLQALDTINTKLGDLESYSQTSWEVRTSEVDDPRGTYYILQYEVQYSKYSAEETLTMFKSENSTDIKIVGHEIDSPGFLEE